MSSTQHASDRRRRRMAGKDNELLAEFSSLTSKTDNDRWEQKAVPRLVDEGLLPRLISPRIWKHVAIVFAIVTVACLSLWLRHDSSVLQARSDLNTVETSRIIPGLSGLCFLISGQLAILIGWIRRRSAVDFNGRYRWWKWLGSFLVGMGILFITDTLQFIPPILVALVEPVLGHVSAARDALIIVPATSLLIVILGRIIPDMSRCRLTQITFCAAVLNSMCLAGFIFFDFVGSNQQLLHDSMLLGSAVLFVSSTLLHVRFVLYVSNDPPEGAVRSNTVAEKSAFEKQPLTETQADEPIDKASADEPSETTPTESVAQPDNDDSQKETTETKATQPVKRSRKARKKRRKAA